MNFAARLTILFCLALASCADSNFLDRSRKDQSILEGTEVDANSPLAQKVVMIVRDFEYSNHEPLFFGLCTGVILNSKTVLTAAHCLDKGFSNLKIILNSNPRFFTLFPEEIFNVVDADIHETYVDFKSKFSENAGALAQDLSVYTQFSDLAVLKVDRSFNIKEKENKILSQPESASFSRTGLVVGFGKTTSLKDTKKINHMQLNAFLNEARIELRPEDLNENFFWRTQMNKAGVCSGDSGSPVFIKENNEFKIVALAIGVFAKKDLGDYTACAGSGLYINLLKEQNWIESAQKKLEAR